MKNFDVEILQGDAFEPLNAEGNKKIDSETIGKFIEVGKDLSEYITTDSGVTLAERGRGQELKSGVETKILGMKPLVFVAVSLGVVLITGVTIAALSGKAIKK